MGVMSIVNEDYNKHNWAGGHHHLVGIDQIPWTIESTECVGVYPRQIFHPVRISLYHLDFSCNIEKSYLVDHPGMVWLNPCTWYNFIPKRNRWVWFTNVAWPELEIHSIWTFIGSSWSSDQGSSEHDNRLHEGSMNIIRSHVSGTIILFHATSVSFNSKFFRVHMHIHRRACAISKGRAAFDTVIILGRPAAFCRCASHLGAVVISSLLATAFFWIEALNMLGDTGASPPSITFPAPMTTTIRFRTDMPPDFKPTFNHLCQASGFAGLGCQLNQMLIPLASDNATTTPPSIEDFRELWCPWDEDLENVTSAFWAAARGSLIDLCPADSPVEVTKDLNLTLFLVDGAATLDLIGRLYSHTAAVENRYFVLRQEFNNLREVVQHLVDAAAQRDPTMASLQNFAKQWAAPTDPPWFDAAFFQAMMQPFFPSCPPASHYCVEPATPKRIFFSGVQAGFFDVPTCHK